MRGRVPPDEEAPRKFHHGLPFLSPQPLEELPLHEVAAKAAAGFTIYAPASQTDRLSAALEDRGLITEILSL